MWGREKISKSLSTGVIVLVFFLLIIQLVIFGVKIYDVYRQRRVLAAEASVQEPLAAGGALANAGSVIGGGTGAGNQAAGTAPAKSSLSAPSVQSAQLPGSGRTIAPRAQSAGNSGAYGRSGTSGSASVAPKRKFSLAPLPPKPAYKPKPKIDINSADTTALMTLYGIGSYYARRIVQFREQLGGSFASTEQLMDIRGIDSARFVGFEGRICLDSALIRRIDFYTYPLDSLAIHPYIGKYAAKGVDRLRRTVPREDFSIALLVENGVISPAQGQRLELYEDTLSVSFRH